ncbi:Polypeptide-transport-associated, FtsQ-type [Trichodesmium erythraeum IMS101]|uniref:Polypeptide-transport-associated, FtsQ-type n=1 Tax=Trichodesmium erythraeum (strain IMS101) TaxID=203124 RepID=Q10Y58_TRIEI|nr:FtsQ-type POTRA domain-containing protein [Trichodesmium erythraeum GBRTRLIN201]MCH2048251.1 FtsQ-type POTRA domain-containing protein [Trichodesmium sp. ALOHA_ZT_67]MDE5093256.1 FtsQ-type POTRA domain-containing protein [Trichodesmium sp. St11_bin5]MDT9341549.1 FtsQ-type POTRA domain-containing protein [Trichodesmium erythraeum 21-75]
MANNIGSVSESDLVSRRQKLRLQRRLKLLVIVWQVLAVGGLGAALLWAITQPIWLITKQEQLTVEGNQLLSDRAILSLISLDYPQSLWVIKTQILAQNLESQSPIAKARISRRLFPPSLNIKIIERRPVAITQFKNQVGINNSQKMGWLDTHGNWIPLESFSALERTGSLPTLKVIGFTGQYRQYWHSLYQSLSRSPVKVFEINWQDPGNLILTTELGIVHLGPYSSRFSEQLNVLDRMRELPNKIDVRQMAYINLKNPDSPLIQLPNKFKAIKIQSN